MRVARGPFPRVASHRHGGGRLGPRLQRAPPNAAPWSFYWSGIAEFVTTFIFLYVSVCGSVLTVMGINKSPSKCGTVGIQQGIV